MKFFDRSVAATAMAIASCIVLGTAKVDAATFEFSEVMGTPKNLPTYDPLSDGSMGAHLLTVTFTGEDLDGDGLLRYIKFGGYSEITEIKATWGGLEFNLDNLWLFTAGRLPDAPENYYGEDILLHEFRFYQGDLHLDYKPINIYEWYEQFRAYRCPVTLNCLDYPTVDVPIAKGLMSGEYLLGFENHFVPGSPAYLVKNIQNPLPAKPPVQSTPEPGAIAGLSLLALSAYQLRKSRIKA